MDVFIDVQRKAAGAANPAAVRQLAILRAVAEAIQEQRKGQDATINEIFVAVLSALKRSDEPQTLGDLVFLADRSASKANVVLLRREFEGIAAAIQGALGAFQAIDNAEERPNASVARCLSLLGTLLAAQEASASRWAAPKMLQLLHTLTSYFDDTRPKVRKAAQLAVTKLLEHHHNLATKAGEGVQTALAKHLGDFATEACREASRAVQDSAGGILRKRETQPVLHLCSFLQLSIAYFPPAALPRIIKELFAVVTASGAGSARARKKGGAMVEMVGYQTLAVAVAHPLCRLEPEVLEGMLQRLVDNPPNRRAADVSSAHARLLASTLLNYAGEEPQKAASLTPRTVQVLVSVLEFGDAPAYKAVAGALANVVQRLLPQLLRTQANVAQEVVSGLGEILRLRLQNSWTASLPLLGNVFSAATDASGADLAPVQELLGQIGDLYDALLKKPEAAPPEARKLLRDAVADAVEYLGPGFVLEVLPLHEDPAVQRSARSTGIREDRTWLLPILRSRISGSPNGGLEFFHTVFLPIATACDTCYRQGDDGTNSATAAATARLRCIAIWGMLTPMARGASDIATALAPLAPTIGGVLGDARYPELLAVACATLQSLVFCSRERAGAPSLQHLLGEASEINVDDDEEHADNADSEVSRHHERALRLAHLGGEETWRSHADVMVLSSFAHRFMPILFSLLDKTDVTPGATVAAVLSSPRISNLSKAITAYASVSPEALLTRLLKQLVQKLLQAAASLTNSSTEKPDEQELTRAVVLCELASALTPFVSKEGASLLFRVVSPLIRVDIAPPLQKRSYKLLAVWLANFGSLVREEDEKLSELVNLMTSSLLTISPSARTQRLKCLRMLVEHLSPETDEAHAAMLPQLVSETVVCTKDANGKARTAAYEFLASLARCSGNIRQFIMDVSGGLNARTPRMRSATALCLAALIFDFGRAPGAPGPRPLSRTADEARDVCGIVPELLEVVLPLLKGGGREVAKAVLALVRVCIGACPADDMERLLSMTVTALMTWTAERDRRSHLRTIVKRILGKLCRKYGFNRISSLVPEGDQPLMAYMEKMARKDAARRKQQREKHGSHMDVNNSEDEDDADDVTWYFSEEEEDAADEMEIAGGQVDLLGNDLGTVRSKRGREDAKLPEDDDGGAMEFDDEGRLVVREEDEEDEDESPFADTAEIAEEEMQQKRRRRDAHDDGSARKVSGQRQRRQGPGRHGAERYKSKKAGGDVLKKGTKLEPYAYIPLDPRSLQGKKQRARGEAVKEFSGVLSKKKKRKGAQGRRRA